jgi:hypothetical protein
MTEVAMKVAAMATAPTGLMADAARLTQQWLLERVLRELDHHQRMLLAWRYGLGCEPLSDEIVKRRLSLSDDELFELESQALEQVGFVLITEIV